MPATLARGAATGDLRARCGRAGFPRHAGRNGLLPVSNRFTLKAFVGRDYTEPSVIEAVTELQVKRC
ncbi:hypothetical protein [Caballeronia telluris]|uniref:hypothetical protein n=1 Tax=Caballeronia telluris TaxID=326475 RepID=UPI003898F9FB